MVDKSNTKCFFIVLYSNDKRLSLKIIEETSRIHRTYFSPNLMTYYGEGGEHAGRPAFGARFASMARCRTPSCGAAVLPTPASPAASCRMMYLAGRR